MNYLELAKQITIQNHKGQKDKAGNDYILHPLAVADKVKTNNEKIVALLHDIVEDTEITIEDLKKYGFSNEVVTAIEVITKKDGEDYNKYIERVKDNELALKVKIADMEHNSDITRFKNPTEKDIKRSEKYKNKLKELKGCYPRERR